MKNIKNIKNEIENVNRYLTNYLKKILDDKIELDKVVGNRLFIKNSIESFSIIILGVKIVNCYSFNDLYTNQFRFFQNLKKFMDYTINGKDIQIYYKYEDVSYKIDEIPYIWGKSNNINFITDIDDYISQEYNDVYEYIKSIISLSLGDSFVMEHFPLNQYRYIVHLRDKDYLLELTSNIK